MSLILDALRRADAERERGNVPGLHTPQPMAPAALPAGGARTSVVVLSVLAGAVFAGGVAAWWHWRQPFGAPAPGPAVVAVAPVLVPVVPPAPVPAPVVAAPVTAAPASPVVPLAVAPAPVVAPKKVEAVKALPAVPLSGSGAVPAAAPATAEPGRVPMLQDLPAAVRQQLPSLAVSGASYSADPAYRMVIVNGQVLHEGDQAGSGVLLEAIAPRIVVFKGLGQRWGQGY